MQSSDHIYSYKTQYVTNYYKTRVHACITHVTYYCVYLPDYIILQILLAIKNLCKYHSCLCCKCEIPVLLPSICLLLTNIDNKPYKSKLYMMQLQVHRVHFQYVSMCVCISARKWLSCSSIRGTPEQYLCVCVGNYGLCKNDKIRQV